MSDSTADNVERWRAQAEALAQKHREVDALMGQPAGWFNQLTTDLRDLGWEVPSREPCDWDELYRARVRELHARVDTVLEQRRAAAEVKRRRNVWPTDAADNTAACPALLALGEEALRQLVPRPFTGFVDRFAERPAATVLLGTAGVGKTVSAMLAVWRLGIASNRRSVFVRATDLAEAVRHHPLGQGESPAFRAASTSTVLVLDDLAWEKDQAPVTRLLQHRYDAGLLTIVTSGLTRDQLRERYGDAIVRRIVAPSGPGSGCVLECWGAK